MTPTSGRHHPFHRDEQRSVLVLIGARRSRLFAINTTPPP